MLTHLALLIHCYPFFFACMGGTAIALTGVGFFTLLDQYEVLV